MMDEILENYSQLIDENIYLKHELNNSKESLRSDQLGDKEEKDEHCNDQIDALRAEIAELERQLADREHEVDECLAKIETLEPQGRAEVEISPFGAHNDSSQQLRKAIQELGKLNDEIDEAFAEKMKLLSDQQAIIDDLRKQLELVGQSNAEVETNCEGKLKEKEDNEKVLAQQIIMLEEQITILMDERKKLMEFNNDLVKSISVCQGELCKYDFE